MTPLAALFVAGCSTIGSLGGGNQSHTDEVWFSRVTSLFTLPLSSTVWYCPASNRPGPMQCIEAVIDGPPPAADEASAPPPTAESHHASAPTAPVVTSERPPPPARAAMSACHDLSLPDLARPVMDVTVRGPLPAATGGTIRDGIYALVRTERHRSFANLFERRMVLRIRSGAFESVSVRGTEAPQSMRGTIRVAPGGNVTFAVDCPAPGQMEFDRFTVTDDGLVLQDQETQRVVMLAREDLPATPSAELASTPASEPAPEAAPVSPEAHAVPAEATPTRGRSSRHHGGRHH